MCCAQVRLPVNRNQDLAMNNGRAAVQVEYDIGFDESGKLRALEMQAGRILPSQACSDWRATLCPHRTACGVHAQALDSMHDGCMALAFWSFAGPVHALLWCMLRASRR
jgi:hypothetical protein